MEGDDRLRRLRWLCRRGMKELDVLLERFVDRNQSRLGAGVWPGLEELLSWEDDRLWDALQNPDLPRANPHRELLKAIRDARAAPA